MYIKRRFVRHNIDKEARLKVEGREDFLDCQIKDLSLKGLQVLLKDKLPEDQYFNLGVSLAEGLSINVEAWVSWHKNIDGYNVYGVYFNKIKDYDKEKIYQFIHKYCTEELTKRWWQDKIEEEGGEKMEDRRIFARFPAEFPLKFLDYVGNKEGFGSTVDISAKGMGLLASEELAPNTSLEMWMDIPDKGEPLYTRGEVVWSKRLEPNRYRIGVELERADLMGLSRAYRVSNGR